MNAGKRLAVGGALLLAGSLAALPAVASAAATVNPGGSAGSVSRSPALHGRFSDPSPSGSAAGLASRIEFWQSLEAAAIEQRDFEQVQGIELVLVPLRDQAERK